VTGVAAVVAAVLFGLALLFQLAGLALSVVTAQVLVAAGLLCVALHLAGVGNTVTVRSHRRRRS
jgi:hypothetical protein